jgi:hypothetical protein
MNQRLNRLRRFELMNNESDQSEILVITRWAASPTLIFSSEENAEYRSLYKQRIAPLIEAIPEFVGETAQGRSFLYEMIALTDLHELFSDQFNKQHILPIKLRS